MKLYTLNIKERLFKVAVISDSEEMKKGLSGKPKLGKNKGLLFDFGEEQSVTMNMVKMNYPLDIIFINEDKKVIAVRPLNPGKATTKVDNARFVLEVNKGMGVGLIGESVEYSKELLEAIYPASCGCDECNKKEESHAEEGVNIIVRVSTSPKTNDKVFKNGGSFKSGGSFKIIEDQVKARKSAMQVLDDSGKVLMNIDGGERIFSIEHTEQLVALAKQVDRGEKDPEELGKLMNKILHKQDTQEPQYVE
jgi:uncharacterized membrane protein (UPF0127 family)